MRQFFSRVWNWTARRAAPKSRKDNRRRTRLGLEALERRDLMSAGNPLPYGIHYDAQDDTVHIVGSSAYNDEAIVAVEPILVGGHALADRVIVRLGYRIGPEVGSPFIQTDQLTLSSLVDPVAKVTFSGYDGDDVFVNNTHIESLALGGNDNDLLKGGSYRDKLVGGTGDDRLYGNGGNDELRGEGGNDQLRGGTGVDYLYGGSQDDDLYGDEGADYMYGDSGKDRLFGGAGADYMYGGLHDDVLVSIGGTQSDVLSGGDGFDSFWLDKEASEVITDVSDQEQDARHIHRVAAFNTNHVVYGIFPIAEEQPSRELNGQELIDPLPHEPGLHLQDFSGNPLFGSTGPVLNEIHQGDIGDCYFLAFLGAIAHTNPDLIRQTVVDLGDDTYAVHFYDTNDNDVFVRVDGDLYRDQLGSPVYARRGVEGSLWVPIIEKAWAFYRNNQGNYPSIEGGGSPGIKLKDAFNLPEQFVKNMPLFGGLNTASEYMQAIKDQLDAGKAVTLSGPTYLESVSMNEETYHNGAHVYTVISVSDDLSQVVLYNPWGVGGPNYNGYITVSADVVFYCSSEFWAWTVDFS